MPRVHPIQASLNAGEFSPRMVARTDFAKYPLACATLENMIPLPQGGATRRPGTRFVAEVKDSSRKVKLRSFEFSTLQAYILECGEGYCRFYKDEGQIFAPTVSAAIINGNFAADISGWTDQSAGSGAISHAVTEQALSLDGGGTGNAAIAEQSISISDNGVEHVLAFRVRGLAGDKVSVRVGSSSGAADLLAVRHYAAGWHSVSFTPSGGTAYLQFENSAQKSVLIDDVGILSNTAVEIGSPYLESQLFETKQAQSADILYLCHPDQPAYKLTRYGHTSWSLVEVGFTDGPWLAVNDSTTTLEPAATTGAGITITASSATGINDDQGFLPTDIGRLVRISNPASGKDWGWGVIAAYISATQVSVDIRRDFARGGGGTASTEWRLGAWCNGCGWPGAVSFQEQRLCFAGTVAQAQTFWMSQSGDFENMSPDSADPDNGLWNDHLEDDDALDFTISADQVNAIRWLAPGKSLFVGTVGGEWAVNSNGPSLTPLDIDVKRQTTFGTANLPPQLMRGRLMFLQRASRKLMEFTFNLEQDNFQALDLNILSEHVTNGGIVDLAYQQEPDSTLWTIRSDGQVPTLTYQPDQNVIGWSRCRIGGVDAGCETVAVIPTGIRDQAWLCIKRTIGGQTRRYVEFVDAVFETGSDQAMACYSDSALVYDGAAATVIAGLDHLESEELVILADGAVHPPRAVTSGSITLDYPATKIIAGLPYAHTYESLKWEAGNPAGTAQGQVKRIHGVTLVLLDSLNASIGPDFASMKKVPFRQVGDAMDQAVPLFTGEKFIEFDGNYATDTRVCIHGSDPVPFTLLAIAPEIKTNGR